MRGFRTLSGTSYQPRHESPLKSKFNKIFKVMKRKYINPSAIVATADRLRLFKENHPKCETPMAEAAAGEPMTERERYYRAARALGWSVCRSKGKTYENGRLVW